MLHSVSETYLELDALNLRPGVLPTLLNAKEYSSLFARGSRSSLKSMNLWAQIFFFILKGTVLPMDKVPDSLGGN